jgi:PncC family amidohydrolase
VTARGRAAETSAEEEARILLEGMSRRGLTFALAESCTGGLVSAAVTSIPGASSSFWGAIVSYANEAKERILSVPRATLNDHGAVSAETVRAMARGALECSGVDLAAAVSGIAGPDGGSPDKPVGTVWIAFASRNGEGIEKLLSLTGDRRTIREDAAAQILSGLRIFMEERFSVLP